jgi:DeoR/GlpR family transcriptional regulator of sugar metabolism
MNQDNSNDPVKNNLTLGSYVNDHEKISITPKKLVAQLVLEYIKDNDSIVIDAGSSATAVARLLLESNKKDLSILTHNMVVFKEYYDTESKNPSMKNHQLLLTGGRYDANYGALYGDLTLSSYEHFHPKVVILAVSGLTATTEPDSYSGVYCHAVVETKVKEALFHFPVERRIIVADHLKIGRVDSHIFGEFKKLVSLHGIGTTCLITTSQKSHDKVKEKKLTEEEKGFDESLFNKTIDALKSFKNIDIKIADDDKIK